MKKFNLEISKQDAWKLIDAIKHYQKDYALNKSADKLFDSILLKLSQILEQ